MNLYNRKFHIIFWISIATISSFLLAMYLTQANRGIIPSVIPITVAIIQIYVSEKTRREVRYFPKKIIYYLLLNAFFFILFLFVLFLLENFIIIKIGTFLIMSLVGTYTSYFLYRERKKITNS